MIEQRFAITVSNEEHSLSMPIPVRSTQQFRSLKRVIESCVKQELQVDSPKFVCIFNGKILLDTDVLEEIGIIDGSCISLVFLTDEESELPYETIIQNHCTVDDMDKELASIYELIDGKRITDAFNQIRAVLFNLDNIPRRVEKLRLRFASVEYSPLIYAGVHELLFYAFKSSVPHDIFLSLLGWYRYIVSKIQKEQRCASASLMIEILKSYSKDAQVINILIPILYNLLNTDDSEDVAKCLSYLDAIMILFACTDSVINSYTLIHVIMILSRLLTKDNTLIDSLNEVTTLDYVSSFLAHCSSATGTNSLLDLTQTLLLSSKFLKAFESKRFLFIFRKYISSYDSVQIRRLCLFFASIAKSDRIKWQLIVSGMLEVIISFSNDQSYDVDLLYSILLLIDQLCTKNEYCIYLTNLGVIDAIQSYLSIHKIESALIPVAFRCFERIITHSWICREHIWDLPTLESLLALLIPEHVSFPVIMAFTSLLNKINEYESGRESLRTLNVVEFIKAFSDLFDDDLQQFQRLNVELDALQNTEPIHKSSDYDYHLLVVYIVPKVLHNTRSSLEIRRRDVKKRTPSGTPVRQSTILRQIQNYDSSSEIDFSTPIKAAKDPLANGEDFYSYLLTDLDSSDDVDYLECLVRCLSVILDPSLFEGVSLYVDMSLIPSILAKVISAHSEVVEIVRGGVIIISTIAQRPFHCNDAVGDSLLDLLLKGDVIEVLNKLIYQYLSHYIICGHSVYVLYLLSQQKEYIDRLIRASVMNSLRFAARETLDVYIRGYAIYALKNLGEDNLPPVPCPAIDMEKPLIELLLSDLESTDNVDHQTDILTTLALAFKYDYKEIGQAFFESNGEAILEDVIRNNADSPKVILSVLKVFQAALSYPRNIQYMEQKNLIGICINVLLRYNQMRDLVKVSIKIIQYLCDHSSSAAVMVPYLSNLHRLLHDYGAVKSICSGIIRILVLVAQIGEQSQLSIINCGILDNIDEVVLIHISHKPLIVNIFTLFEVLSSTNEGSDYLASHCYFSISMRVLQRFSREESVEYDDIMTKAFIVIQSIVEKRPGAMKYFLEARGYKTLLLVCSLKAVSRVVKQMGLNCLMLLFQIELGDDQLGGLNLVHSLLQSDCDMSWLSSVWMCCSYFIEYHCQLLTVDDCIFIYNSALQCIAKSIEDCNLIASVIRTLFFCSSNPFFLDQLKEKRLNIDYDSLSKAVTSVKNYYKKNIDVVLLCVVIQLYLEDEQEMRASFLAEAVSILRTALSNPTIDMLDTVVRVCEVTDIINHLFNRETCDLLLIDLKQFMDNDEAFGKIIAILSSIDLVYFERECDVGSLFSILLQRFGDSKEVLPSTLSVCTLFIEIMSECDSVLSFIMQPSFLSSFLSHFTLITPIDIMIHAFTIVFKVLEMQGDNKDIKEWISRLEYMKVTDDAILIRIQLLHYICNDVSNALSTNDLIYLFFRYVNSKVDSIEAVSLCGIITKCPLLYNTFIENGGMAYLHNCLENNCNHPAVVESVRCLYEELLSNDERWYHECLYLFSFESLQCRNELFYQVYQTLIHLNWNDSQVPSIEVKDIDNLIAGIKKLNIDDRECLDVISLLCLFLQYPEPGIICIIELILQITAIHCQSNHVLDMVQSLFEDLESDSSNFSSICDISGPYLLKMFRECDESCVRIVCGMIQIATPDEDSADSIIEDIVSISSNWLMKTSNYDALMGIHSLLLWLCRYENIWISLNNCDSLQSMIESIINSSSESTSIAFRELLQVLQQGVSKGNSMEESFPHRPAPPVLYLNK